MISINETVIGQLGGYYTGVTTVQPYFSMSSLFTEKALSTGILIPASEGPLKSQTGQYYQVNQEVLNTLTQTGGSNKVATNGGIPILPLLLIGGAILLLGGK